MALSPRWLLLPAFLLSVFFIGPSVDARSPVAADQARITAVANVTLRAEPSAASPAIAQLPLGTEVREAGPAGLDKTWVLVRLSDTREGWIQARLTRPLDPVWRWPVFDAIIAERLDRKGDGFPALAELVAFIERVAPEYTDRDGRARIELARLRALSRTAAAVPAAQSRREPYASWLAARGPQLVYDDPGGTWMVRDTAIWQVHAAHASTSVADDIAWFAVASGLAGECGGRLACYFSVMNRRHGEYLRAHPAGRHAGEAVGAVQGLVDRVAPAGSLHRRYTLDRTNGCRDLVPAIDALAAAIQGSRAVGWDTTTANLGVVRKLCP